MRFLINFADVRPKFIKFGAAVEGEIENEKLGGDEKEAKKCLPVAFSCRMVTISFAFN